MAPRAGCRPLNAEIEYAYEICLGCADEAEDHYPAIGDCECHERGYN